MVPKPHPFSTDDVAKANKRLGVLRVFAVSIAACLTIGFANHASGATLLRLIFLDGIPYGCFLILVRRVIPNVRMQSFGLSLLFRSFVYTIVFIVAIILMIVSLHMSEQVVAQIGRSKEFIAITLILFYIWVLIVTAVRGVSSKLGPSAFRNWIRGYYFTPKEEERIFMFLDMRHSTQLAEQLGDLKFSKLVRDFFEDLTDPILESLAEVSHYIGDEAVLTWWPKTGLPDARCLQCFFRMQLAIDRRRAYYMREYGLVPEFKAGAHIGRVVATEVGKIKSEIVFHGDVLNTTARVQGACAEFGVDLLITEALAKRLPETSWLDLSPIGGVSLKGKSEKVDLVSARVRSK